MKSLNSATSMAHLMELLDPFAKSINAKRAALENSNLDLTSNQRARFREAICDDIKKCSNFVVPEVSEAALKVAKDIGVNLFKQSWHDQSAFDAGRETFHFEHVQPVSAIRDCCIKCSSEAEIHKVLKEKLRVAWILKEEDDALTHLGYRSKRDNPDIAYREVKIVLQKQGT
jgi:hypothetical protein